MKPISPRHLWIGTAALGGVAALAGIALLAAHAENAPSPARADPSPGAAPGAAPVAAPPPAGAPAPNGNPPSEAEPPPAPTRTPRTTVRIVFKVVPPTNATVSWGKKKLGVIKPRAPLLVERPRDSGPLDVIVRAEGCLPVHTRAYTFTDTTVAVKVTPLDKKNTVYGYREAPPPDADAGVPDIGVPDGGAPLP